jgi:hypothetical protein
LDLKRTLLKKIILSLLLGSIFLTACRKSDILLPITETVPCVLQSANPSGRSYTADDLVTFTCTEKHCGIIPLSSKNYWIYEDSIFTNGVFTKVQFDTLRYQTNKKSLPDGLVWWEGNIQVGLPDIIYANDSSFFDLADRLFTPEIKDVKKEFGLFPGDSLRFLTSFEDAAAIGRSLKIETPLQTPAGTFNDCFYFEKNARNYRKDQVFFKPGIGVIKYIFEKAPVGQRVIKLQQVSTLVSFYID